MAAIKSIKCYNFTPIRGSNSPTFSMQFYDSKSQLVILDFSNPIGNSTTTHCETNECIVTSKGTIYSDGYSYHAFHTANTNNTLGLKPLGGNNCWYLNSNEELNNAWIKIEFRVPIKLSDIKILNSYWGPNYGFDSCDYDVEYANGTIETDHYKSDGQFISIHWTVAYENRDQNIVDAKFKSIDFNKSVSVYDTKIGYIETLDVNNFRNIPINTVEKLKVLYVKPPGTLVSCLVSFDKKQTWKSFNGTNWVDITDSSPENIILNCMDIEQLNQLDKNKLISGGFTGDLDFKIAMKTNDVNKTSSITKIYLEYKLASK